MRRMDGIWEVSACACAYVLVKRTRAKEGLKMSFVQCGHHTALNFFSDLLPLSLFISSIILIKQANFSSQSSRYSQCYPKIPNVYISRDYSVNIFLFVLGYVISFIKMDIPSDPSVRSRLGLEELYRDHFSSDMGSWVHPHILCSKSHRPPRDERVVGAGEREKERANQIILIFHDLGPCCRLSHNTHILYVPREISRHICLTAWLTILV